MPPAGNWTATGPARATAAERCCIWMQAEGEGHLALCSSPGAASRPVGSRGVRNSMKVNRNSMKLKWSNPTGSPPCYIISQEPTYHGASGAKRAGTVGNIGGDAVLKVLPPGLWRNHARERLVGGSVAPRTARVDQLEVQPHSAVDPVCECVAQRCAGYAMLRAAHCIGGKAETRTNVFEGCAPPPQACGSSDADVMQTLCKHNANTMQTLLLR